MTNKSDSKTKAAKSTAKAEGKAKDLVTKKSPKGGGGEFWGGKYPNHSPIFLSWMRER